MDFLKKEVAIQDKIEMVESTFLPEAAKESSSHTSQRFKGSNRDKKRNEDVPTMSGCHARDASICIFCDKSHRSQECFTAMDLPFDEKIKIIRDKKVCFVCLRPGHRSKNCKTHVKCISCHRRHYTIMCNSGKNDQQQPQGSRNEDKGAGNQEGETQTNSLSGCSNHVCSSAVALQTLLVDVIYQSKKKTVRAFIDSGSQRSYILKSTVEELGMMSYGTERVTHSLFTGSKTATVTHHKFKFHLGRCGGGFSCEVEMRDQWKICDLIPRIPRDPKLLSLLRKKRVFVTDVGETTPPIEVLIGADLYAILLTGKAIQISEGITAVDTKLGWTLLGQHEREDRVDTVGLTVLSMTAQDAPITNLWKLESIGITDDGEHQTAAQREEEAKKDFVKSIKRREDGRYSISMPWVKDHPPLPTNKKHCVIRLERETKKLMDAGNYAKYDGVLKEWVNEFTERVEECNEGGHFIPQRPVLKESLTTPVRPVFDCSCRVGKGPSLNDCLHKGNVDLQMIPELLLRFREKKVGVTADIRKAFQMIEVDPPDRKYLQFLWWEDYSTKKMVVYQHARVPFGATCSPFILGAVLEHHLHNVSQPDKEDANKLLRGLYVDNYVGSEDTFDDYQLFKKKATQLLQDARMELRMWMSNEDEIEDPSTRIISVLGMKWDRQDDNLSVNAFSIGEPEVLTKRTLLSTVH